MNSMRARYIITRARTDNTAPEKDQSGDYRERRQRQRWQEAAKRVSTQQNTKGLYNYYIEWKWRNACTAAAWGVWVRGFELVEGNNYFNNYYFFNFHIGLCVDYASTRAPIIPTPPPPHSLPIQTLAKLSLKSHKDGLSFIISYSRVARAQVAFCALVYICSALTIRRAVFVSGF